MKPLQGFLGARTEKDGVRFGVYAPDATGVWVCLFDAEDKETARHTLKRSGNGVWTATINGIGAGQRYGLRADGPFDPPSGYWFDPSKLLVDPFVTRIDRPFRQRASLSAPRAKGKDTTPFVPKALVEAHHSAEVRGPRFVHGNLIYELNVRAFTMLHPDIPEAERGKLTALRHPSVVAHFKKLGVGAVELMPIAAWIDEAHLGPLGLTNAWGYNPIAFMALDPRLAPNGIADLRAVTDALRDAGISTILDVVYNHTGEGDTRGPALSLRGLAGRHVYRRAKDGTLINDAGTGNTVACDDPFVVRLVTDTLRHFVIAGGVDGFRFDLATILGRTAHNFTPQAPLLSAIRKDPVLKDRVLIAEPWDIGPGGYQAGNFGEPYLEWIDRYRDDVRMFWRDDAHKIGALASRLAGSSDIYHRGTVTRTRAVNFIAAHDGFTLADLVAYQRKHNAANGEDNRDGHNENHSWNNGAEGETRNRKILAARKRDLRALLATLFASRGSIMLAAGDESGRTQMGNNNAYAQDNAITWLDWKRRDRELEDYATRLSALRRDWPHLRDTRFFSGRTESGGPHPDVAWLRPDGEPMSGADWNAPDADALVMVIAHPEQGGGPRLAIAFNRKHDSIPLSLPEREGFYWQVLSESTEPNAIPARGVIYFGESKARTA